MSLLHSLFCSAIMGVCVCVCAGEVPVNGFWEKQEGEHGLVLKEKPFIKLHCVLRKDTFKLLFFL